MSADLALLRFPTLERAEQAFAGCDESHELCDDDSHRSV